MHPQPTRSLTTAHPQPRPPGAARAWRRGFTLIEMMVTLSVLVVVMSVALPSMSDFVAGNQMANAKTSLSGAVALARTEATKRGQVVILAAIGDGPTGNEFVNGWEIVVDEDGNGAAGVNEPRVRRAAGLQDKIKVAGPRALAFRASGALLGTAAEVFTVCRTAGSGTGYTVTVTPSGVTDVAAISTCG